MRRATPRQMRIPRQVEESGTCPGLLNLFRHFQASSAWRQRHSGDPTKSRVFGNDVALMYNDADMRNGAGSGEFMVFERSLATWSLSIA